MKKFLIFTFISAFLCACSTETNTQNTIVDKVRGNTNSQNANANVIQNANTIENINDAPINPANSTNSVDANLGLSENPINRKLQKMNNSATVSTEKPKLTFVPAPQNSGVATKMGDNGEFIQIRVFNSDPQIKSIEQVVTTDKLKIVLKNGKVLNVTVDKDFNSERFISISPQEILILAGLAKKPDESQTGSK